MRRIMPSTNRIHRVLKRVLCICALLYPVAALAQDIQYTQNVADATLRGRFRVDPSTLGLSLQIPLGSYPARGSASFPITLYYSAKVWNVNFVETHEDVNGNPLYNILEPAYGQHSVAGWACSLTPPRIEWTGYMAETYEFGVSKGCAPPPTTRPCEYISRIRVYMPDGSSHELRKDDLARDARMPYDRTGSFVSVDASQLRFEASSNTLFLPDGSSYLFTQQTNEQSAIQYVDRNGNTLTYNQTSRQWTDSMGRVIGLPLPVDPADGGQGYGYIPDRPPAGDYPYTLPGVSGSSYPSISYTLRWRTLSQSLTDATQPLRYRADHSFDVFNPGLPGPFLFVTNPGTLGPEEEPAAPLIASRLCSSSELFNPVVLQEIVLPNGQSYRFSYNVFGEIDKVIYPSGGYERYNHARVKGTSYLVPVYAQANRGIVDHFVSPKGDGSDESHWQYSAGYPFSGAPYTVSVTAPDGTRTDRLLHISRSSLSIHFGFDDARAGMGYDERVYSATNQMLRRTLTEWTWDGPTPGGDASAMRNQRVAKHVEILLDTSGLALTKTTTYQYDADLNVTSTTQNDFVSVDQTTAQTADISTFAAGSPLRTVEATYLVNDPAIASSVRSAYRNRQLITLPTLTVTKNGASTRVAETQMLYDESAYPLLTYSPPPPQWIDPATSYRGNPTTTRHWLDTTAGYLENHAQYDQAGNPRKSWDARGNMAEMQYSSTYSYAYPTLHRTPIPDPSGVTGSSAALETTYVFDASTGLLTSTTEANLQTTTFQYNDQFNRLTSTVRPTGGGSTNISYSDTPGNFYVRTQTALDTSRSLDSYQYFDGLGRTSRSFTWEGSGYIVTDTQYDSMLRVWRVSNPYRSVSLGGPINPSGEWTTSTYDALGRVGSVTTPDNAVATTSYDVNQMTVRDQANKQRRSTTDALGRLSSVDEMYEWPSTQVYATTAYQYDALDDLTTVTQGTQASRTFGYDSLKRLKQAFNPESGTILYTYDANSNLLTKLDARSITTTYGYDALNRVVSRGYSGEAVPTPTVSYKYEGAGVTGGVAFSKGKLTLVSSSVSGYSYDEFDAVGRLKRCKQTTGAVDYSMSYTWDLASNMTSEVYPSGRTISMGYDAAGRLLQLTGTKSGEQPKTYASNIGYAPHGAVASMTVGPPANNLAEATTFNNRLQPTQITLGTLASFAYTYGVLDGAVLDTTKNNGNVQSQTVSIGTTAIKQSYTYDQVNRLLSAQEALNGASRWTQSYGFDRWGNRTSLVNTGSDVLPTQSTPAIDPSNNRLVGFGYDDAGNVTTNPSSQSFTYDAENRQKSFTSGAITYNYSCDGEGRRVKREYNDGTLHTTIFVYSATGQLIAEYNSDPVPPPQGGGGTSYLATDHLGSTRVVTNSSGAVKARYDYLPFGEEIGAPIGGRTAAMGYGGADSTREKFTQKERDSESALDYFLARYYSSAQGRFTSSDSFGGSTHNPQTLNLYAYVGNNPLRFVDPTGHFIVEKSSFDYLFGIDSPTSQQGSERGGSVVDGLIATLNQQQDPIKLGKLDEISVKAGELATKKPGFFSRVWGAIRGGSGKIGGGLKWFGKGSLTVLHIGWELAFPGDYPGGHNGTVGGGGPGDEMQKLEQDLYAIGNVKDGVTVRAGYDIDVDADGTVKAQSPPRPQGKSTFEREDQNPGLTGILYRLPAGTLIKYGLAEVRDGRDVVEGSPHAPGHHSVYPTRRMSFTEFNDLVHNMGWESIKRIK